MGKIIDALRRLGTKMTGKSTTGGVIETTSDLEEFSISYLGNE